MWTPMIPFSKLLEKDHGEILSRNKAASYSTAARRGSGGSTADGAGKDASLESYVVSSAGQPGQYSGSQSARDAAGQ